jgi:hypothetical protein
MGVERSKRAYGPSTVNPSIMLLKMSTITTGIDAGHVPTRFSFSTAISTRVPWVGAMRGSSRIPLTAKIASVDETTIAALDDSPEPAGTVPVTSKSTGIGDDLGPFNSGLK